MRVIFWQNIQAFYQAPHIRALSQRHEVLWVLEEQLTDDRKALGWSVPDAGNAVVTIGPRSAEVRRLVNERPQESVHIFSGIAAYPLVEEAFRCCLPTPAGMGLLVENRDDRGLRGLGRLMMYRRDHRLFGRRIDFVLNMGYGGTHGGRRWYRRCGYPDSKIFPYGYFPEPPRTDAFVPLLTGPMQLMYLGQCVPRKGVDLLLDALAPLAALDWTLKIVGDGSAKKAWADRADRLGLRDRVRFLPAMANGAAMDVLAESDLFILPSRFDGWGVVVNEALLRGVPVICSDRCGASDLLRSSWRGETFVSGSVPDLRNVLRRWINQGRRTAEETRRIKDWSRCLYGDDAADYLLAVLEHCYHQGRRPVPPWFSGGVMP